MRVIPCVALASFAAASIQAQDVSARADSIMRVAETKGFSGVVRLARNGSVILEKGYGLANREAKIPFSPATVVQIGSNTKDFTAVAILQLQERGLISLDDKLGKFFPEAPDDKKDITVRQLLRHRAGFPLGLGGDFEPLGREDLVRRAMGFKLLFTPGTSQNYSNTGYSLLAAIIEQLSGKTYEQFVHDNILSPLGLTKTGFILPRFSSVELAHGYRESGEDAGTMLAKPHASDGNYWNLRGNGGLLSTLADMHAFYRALFETGKLIKLENREMFEPDEPVAMAGSDLVNFFLYEREPRDGFEILIASTNAAMKAPAVRGDLAAALGLSGIGQESKRGAGREITKPAGTPVAEGASRVVDEFVAVLNSGDKSVLEKFVLANFVVTAESPSAGERAERLGAVRSELGNVTIVSKVKLDGGPVHVAVKGERESALLIFDMEETAPFRIRRFGLQIGN